MPAVVRAFIALELSDPVRVAMAKVQDDLKESGARVGWVLPENAHLTMIFFGDVLEETIPDLTRCLDEAAAQVPHFKFKVSGVGFFGSPRAPRVIWAGVPNPSPEFQRLYESAASAVQGVGFKLEARPFVPHVTLGRIRAAIHVRELTSRAEAHKDTPFGEVGVRRLLLMRSHLDEPRARYSILHESPLKGT